jgi:hypothetical protein
LWRKFIADPFQKLLGKMSEKSSKNGEGAEVKAEKSEELTKKRERVAHVSEVWQASLLHRETAEGRQGLLRGRPLQGLQERGAR